VQEGVQCFFGMRGGGLKKKKKKKRVGDRTKGEPGDLPNGGGGDSYHGKKGKARATRETKRGHRGKGDVQATGKGRGRGVAPHRNKGPVVIGFPESKQNLRQQPERENTSCWGKCDRSVLEGQDVFEKSKRGQEVRHQAAGQ